MKSLLTFLMDIPFQRQLLADNKEKRNPRPVILGKGPSESKLFMNAHGPYVFTGRSFPLGFTVSLKKRKSKPKGRKRSSSQ